MKALFLGKRRFQNQINKKRKENEPTVSDCINSSISGKKRVKGKDGLNAKLKSTASSLYHFSDKLEA